MQTIEAGRDGSMIDCETEGDKEAYRQVNAGRQTSYGGTSPW